jgi:hypothetical protein
VYVDEDGVLVGQREFKTGAPALPAWASSSTIAIKDWTLHYDGKVAVASYVDDQTARVGNQELHDQFLSVDTWIKRERAWKLLASYTIPLNQDPAPAHLAPQDLQQYVGVYSIDHGQTVKIASDGAALTRTGSDGKSASLSAVARDIFVITGTDAGYGRPLVVFKRDADGKVSGYVNRDLTIPKLDAQADSATGTPPAVHSTLVLRDFIAHSAGDVVVATFFHDRTTDFGTRSLHATYRSMETWVKRPDGGKMITSQGRELLPDAQTTSLAAAELGHYEGVYSAGANLAVKIALDGDALVASAPNSAPMRLLPVTRDYFIVRGSPRIGVLFVRDATGQITGYLSRRDGRDVSFTRT